MNFDNIIQDCGVIYCVTGTNLSRYDDAIKSATSIKKFIPNLSITLFSDNTTFANNVFDQILPIEPHVVGNTFLRRIQAMNKSPYKRTLALDADTLIISDKIKEVFYLLDNFDVGVAHSPIRKTTLVDEVPSSFGQFNCGVILFRNSPEAISLLQMWEKLMATGDSKWINPDDQGCFRYCAWKSNARIATLLPEYNLRTPFPAFIGAAYEAVILHGKDYHEEYLTERVNKTLENRVLLPGAPYVFNGSVVFTENSKLAIILKNIGKLYSIVLKVINYARTK